jgi:uncharacterized protein YkwD
MRLINCAKAQENGDRYFGVILIRISLAAFAVFAAAVFSGGTPLARAASSADLAPRATCPGQAATAAPVSTQLRAMRCLINWTRRHNGMALVRDQTELDRSAAIRGNDIRRCGDFSHTPCGQSFLQVFMAVHYLAGTGTVGENLSWGQGRLASARATMVGWLTSPDHRQIIFTADWRDLGLSLSRSRSLFGQPNVSLWVAQFGHRRALLGP